MNHLTDELTAHETTTWTGDTSAPFVFPFQFGNDRERNIKKSAFAALDMLRAELLKN